MRKSLKLVLSVIVIALMGIMSVTTIAKSDDKPTIKFDKKVHDFGMIKEDGGPVTYEFSFINNGPGAVVITSATAQCGCTKPEFPEAPIAKGAKGKIKVTFNPLGRPGSFTKKVTIRSNAKNSPETLKITGTVIPKK